MLWLAPSGCGKSTLLQLLMGGSNYDGEIFCDGHELQGISSRSLYALTSHISQNVFFSTPPFWKMLRCSGIFPKKK